MANDFIGDQVPVTQNCPTCEQLENEIQQLKEENKTLKAENRALKQLNKKLEKEE